MNKQVIRTAEFVSPKHPDKICDRISDTLLDKFLEQDPTSRCAIETMGGHGKVWITGEVTSRGNISNEEIKQIVNDISGVEDVTIHIAKQSPEIARGVDYGGAGDQGVMIGYACKNRFEETGIVKTKYGTHKSYLPEEYFLARFINKYIYDNHYQTDGKTQVTLYDDDKALVVCSFQNSKSDLLKSTISDILYRLRLTPYGDMGGILCNPAGEWTVGGLDADAGLTGRKIVVDAYGPRIPVGGGAFSGKDGTKVDRSGAYMARMIARKLLKEYDANEVMVRLAYAIGYTQPIEATAFIDGKQMDIPYVGYDLRPQAIIERLDLRKPIYAETAEWGAFGHSKFSWEI